MVQIALGGVPDPDRFAEDNSAAALPRDRFDACA